MWFIKCLTGPRRNALVRRDDVAEYVQVRQGFVGGLHKSMQDYLDSRAKAMFWLLVASLFFVVVGFIVFISLPILESRISIRPVAAWTLLPLIGIISLYAASVCVLSYGHAGAAGV